MPGPSRRPIEDRFWPRVAEGPSGCWIWTGGRSSRGYGVVPLGGRTGTGLAHRVAYELVVGVIPPGLVIDHLCRVPLCVNPAHLEAVTQRENIRRGHGVAMAVHLTGICVRGHRLADHGHRRPNGETYCKACRRARDRGDVAAYDWKDEAGCLSSSRV